MQIDIIVMCPAFFLIDSPKYQLSDIATVEKVIEDMEEELADKCVIFVFYWNSMMMGSYLLLGSCLIYVLPVVSVRIQICSITFSNS